MQASSESHEPHSKIEGSTQLTIVQAILATEIFIYFFVLVFIAMNFYRILIKQRKITLIPLTVFYVSACIITIARTVDCYAFIKYYGQG